MGEANFYLKAKYPTPGAAAKGAKLLNALIAEKAGNWWQDNRHRPIPEMPSDFVYAKGSGADVEWKMECRRKWWNEFKQLHPLSWEVLQVLDPKNLGYSSSASGWNEIDYNNGPAGHLDFFENFDREITADSSNEIWYACTCWHIATWNHLCQWLIDKGALAADWVSDEYANLFDCIHLD